MVRGCDITLAENHSPRSHVMRVAWCLAVVCCWWTIGSLPAQEATPSRKASVMAAMKERWHGTLIFIGQPAEEIGAGAKAMLEDGLLQRFPRPDFALALHCDGRYPTGHVNYREGQMQANVDSVDIIVKGKGGHGAAPHATIDPIVIAARIVLDLQTIVSRERNPLEPAVVTVGSIHGGTKHNIIPDDCKLQI